MNSPLVRPESFELAALGLGTVTGLGAWSILAALWARGAPLGSTGSANLTQRIARSLRDVSPAARAELSARPDDPISVWGVVVSPSIIAAMRKLESLIGGSDQAARLATAAGALHSVDEFRLRRVASGLVGSTLGILGAATWVGFQAPSLASGALGTLASVALGAVFGVGVWDQGVRKTIARRQQRLREEFPSVVELLALALAAGESVPGALRRISERGEGELARQWATVLRQVELGQPLAASLRESAEGLSVVEVVRLTEHLATALERGAPLVDIVRSHSADSRGEQIRAIVERAGKAEVWMLVPLVLLILPTTVIFAVWPSLQALQLGL